MFKKLIITAAVLGSLVSPTVAFAQENCTTVYGGGVVCGAKTEHKPVDTALDINPIIIGLSLIGASFGFSLLSKKVKGSSDTFDY
jgi:hypothetical protein